MESSTNSNLYTKSSSTSSTDERKIPGSTQNMYGTGSNKSFEETNLEQVPNIRGNGDTDFSKKITMEIMMKRLTSPTQVKT